MLTKAQSRVFRSSRNSVLAGFKRQGPYSRLFDRGIRRVFSKKQDDDEQIEASRPRFGFYEDSYSQYLEEKEDIERQRSKLILEIPHLNNPQLLNLVRRLAKYHMMDHQLFILLEKTLMNRLGDFEDNSLKELVKELCFQAPAFKFRDFLFLEKRIEVCLENSTKYNINEWLPLLAAIAVSGQPVSGNFSKMITDKFALHLSSLTEEDKLSLLGIVVLTNQGKPDDIPKQLLAKLGKILTTQEFVSSVPIVRRLYEQHNSHLVPDEYKQKVIHFIEKTENNTITLQANIVELCDLLQLGNLGTEIKKLVLYCQDNFTSLSFSNLTRALGLVIKYSKKNPEVVIQYLPNLMELQNDLANYIIENGSSANLSELFQLGKSYCEVTQLLKIENPDHRKAVMVILKEGAELLAEEKDPSKYLSFLGLIENLLESPHKTYLLKGNEILEFLTNGLESWSTLRSSDTMYLSLLATAFPTISQVYKSKSLTPTQISKLIDPIMTKATSVKLTSFEKFVGCMTWLDQYSDLVGLPANRTIVLVKEQLLDKYKPPEKK